MLMIALVLLAGCAAVSNAVAPAACSTCDPAAYIAANTTCSVFKTFMACLETATDGPCNIDSTLAGKIAGASNCASDANYPKSACMCQKEYGSVARDSDTLKCTGHTELIGCLAGKSGSSCNAVAKHTYAATISTKRAAITGCSAALTATCTCQKTIAMADVSDDTKLCAALATEVTCLTAITNSTADSCKVATTNMAVSSSATAWQTTKNCNGNNGAGHLTFTLTTLILPLVAKFFL